MVLNKLSCIIRDCCKEVGESSAELSLESLFEIMHYKICTIKIFC